MKIKVGILTPVLYLLLLTLFSSCESDPVAVEPEESFHIADYLPLQEGSSCKYSYYYQETDYNPTDFTASIEGICELKVRKVFIANKYTSASMEVTFNMTKSNLSGFRDTTFSRTFDILQTPDSIWYVTGAPSLERLNEGTRIPLMSPSLGENNQFDFRMFALDLDTAFRYKGELEFKGIPLESLGNTLVYHIDNINFDGNPTSGTRTTITLVRGKGIQSIDHWDIVRMTPSHSEDVQVRIELIE